MQKTLFLEKQEENIYSKRKTDHSNKKKIVKTYLSDKIRLFS